MRLRTLIFLLCLAAAPALCDDQPVALLPCGEGNPNSPGCNPSARELKHAKAAFAKGLKLQNSHHPDEAFEEFEKAAMLNPRDVVMVTTREMARQQLVYERVQSGNTELAKGRQVEAMAQFRAALDLDPENQFAQQRLQDSLTEWAPKPVVVPVDEDRGILHIQPNDVRREFHYRGDSRGLLTQVGTAYGLTVVIDDSVTNRQVRFTLDSTDFFTAMRTAGAATHTFWSPLSEKEILIASETPENHRQFDRMAMLTFSVPSATTPTELTEVTNIFRTLFDIRFVTPQPQLGRIVVRAPQPVLEAASRVIDNLRDVRPQMLLDIHVYEVSRNLTRNMGLHIPNQFTMFNIPAGALAALGGQNIQDLINQLISSGGINQAGSEAISALLAQLGNQQNSLFSQPVGTFGGGLTLMAVTIDPASITMALNESMSKSLEHATLRVAHGSDATFRLGSRYPILNASFAPIFNNPALSNVIQNNSFQAAFPSFNYEDLGLTIKAKPLVDYSGNVTLNLELQFRALAAASLNGVPVISNREYKGSIALMNGEPAVVAGEISHTEQKSLSGIPGLGQVPGLNQVMATNNNEDDSDELLVVITPHLFSPSSTQRDPEVWLGR